MLSHEKPSDKEFRWQLYTLTLTKVWAHQVFPGHWQDHFLLYYVLQHLQYIIKWYNPPHMSIHHTNTILFSTGILRLPSDMTSRDLNIFFDATDWMPFWLAKLST